MVRAAEWDSEFVADLATVRARLGEAQMMRANRSASADQKGQSSKIVVLLRRRAGRSVAASRRRRQAHGTIMNERNDIGPTKSKESNSRSSTNVGCALLGLRLNGSFGSAGN